jgi:hypothetical protein
MLDPPSIIFSHLSQMKSLISEYNCASSCLLPKSIPRLKMHNWHVHYELHPVYSLIKSTCYYFIFPFTKHDHKSSWLFVFTLLVPFQYYIRPTWYLRVIQETSYHIDLAYLCVMTCIYGYYLLSLIIYCVLVAMLPFYVYTNHYDI